MLQSYSGGSKHPSRHGICKISVLRPAFPRKPYRQLHSKHNKYTGTAAFDRIWRLCQGCRMEETHSSLTAKAGPKDYQTPRSRARKLQQAQVKSQRSTFQEDIKFWTWHLVQGDILSNSCLMQNTRQSLKYLDFLWCSLEFSHCHNQNSSYANSLLCSQFSVDCRQLFHMQLGAISSTPATKSAYKLGVTKLCCSESLHYLLHSW